jgi:transcriptional regulator with XRE-family HTH domain
MTERGMRYAILVGIELKAEAIAKGIQINAMADQLKIHRGTLSRYLNGQRVTDVETLMDICQVLDVEPSVILERATFRLSSESDR